VVTWTQIVRSILDVRCFSTFCGTTYPQLAISLDFSVGRKSSSQSLMFLLVSFRVSVVWFTIHHCVETCTVV